MQLAQFLPVAIPTSIRDQVFSAYGEPALRAIGAVIARTHLLAESDGTAKYGRVGFDRCGVLRWIQIDKELLALNGQFEGVSVDFVKNDTTGARHIEITAGRFKMLLCHHRSPNAYIPVSLYGKHLAASNQAELFRDVAPPPTSTDDCCYIFLFHSKSTFRDSLPTKLEIRFPDGRDGYAAEHIRLFSAFPELADPAWLMRSRVETTAPAVIVAEETVQDQAVPSLRSARKTAE